jgi:hypothetical protein
MSLHLTITLRYNCKFLFSVFSPLIIFFNGLHGFIFINRNFDLSILVKYTLFCFSGCKQYNNATCYTECFYKMDLLTSHINKLYCWKQKCLPEPAHLAHFSQYVDKVCMSESVENCFLIPLTLSPVNPHWTQG